PLGSLRLRLRRRLREQVPPRAPRSPLGLRAREERLWGHSVSACGVASVSKSLLVHHAAPWAACARGAPLGSLRLRLRRRLREQVPPRAPRSPLGLRAREERL